MAVVRFCKLSRRAVLQVCTNVSEEGTMFVLRVHFYHMRKVVLLICRKYLYPEDEGSMFLLYSVANLAYYTNY